MWFAVLVPLGQYIIYIVSRFGFFFLLTQLLRAEAQQWLDQLTEWTSRLSEWEAVGRPFLLAAAGVTIASVARRRRNGTLGIFGLVVAWTQLLKGLTSYGRPLASYRFEYSHVDFVMVGMLLSVTLVWLFRSQLTRERMLRLFAVSALLALLNQTSFLDNPFSPLFGFAGSAFLVFGVFWNVIDVAGHFVNRSTPALPRESRALLYIGYALLAVAANHWFIASHNLVLQQYQSDLTYLAFKDLGFPLAYTVILEGGRSLLTEQSAGPAAADSTTFIEQGA
jgi:hypothetical protein